MYRYRGGTSPRLQLDGLSIRSRLKPSSTRRVPSTRTPCPEAVSTPGSYRYEYTQQTRHYRANGWGNSVWSGPGLSGLLRLRRFAPASNTSTRPEEAKEGGPWSWSRTYIGTHIRMYIQIRALSCEYIGPALFPITFTTLYSFPPSSPASGSCFTALPLSS